DAEGYHRLIDAYGVLLDVDKTWTQGEHDFKFTTCSGAQYYDVAERPDSQLAKAGKIDMMTLTIGGNNHFFTDIMNSCIFQPSFSDYGPAWPDPASQCAKFVADAKSNLDDPSKTR